MACWPAALLLLLSAAGAAADPVTDGFESESLGPLGNSRFVTPGRVSVQSELVHSGATALRVELREGDVAMVGVDGVDTERTEVQEADGLNDDYRKDCLAR